MNDSGTSTLAHKYSSIRSFEYLSAVARIKVPYLTSKLLRSGDCKITLQYVRKVR